MKDKKGKTIWVEELCGFLRELAERPTEYIRNFGTCYLVRVFGDENGRSNILDYEFQEIGAFFSLCSGSEVYPVGGIEEYDDGLRMGNHLWDNELRREYALELADRIEEAWEAAA